MHYPTSMAYSDATWAHLAVDATAIVTIVVVPNTVAVATTITNTATVTGTEQDPTPGNNTATEDTTVNSPSADMSISTSSSPATPMINEPVTFSMTVTNNGLQRQYRRRCCRCVAG